MTLRRAQPPVSSSPQLSAQDSRGSPASSHSIQICPPDRLVYGMQVPVTAQSTVFVAPWEATAGTEEILKIAQACDRNDFFYLAVSDHVCVPREQAAAM